MPKYVIAYSDVAQGQIMRATVVANSENEARVAFAGFCGVPMHSIIYCYETANADELCHHNKCWLKFGKGDR